MPTVTMNLPATTFVSSAKLNSNFLVYPLVCVGTDANLKKCTALINVMIPALPKKVDSATLQLSPIMKSGTAPSTIAISQLGTDFDADTVTYNTMPALISTEAEFTVSKEELYLPVQADITDIVNAWLSGAAVNHGIALTGSDGTIVQFATNNIGHEPYFPMLSVTYSSTPATPADRTYGYI